MYEVKGGSFGINEIFGVDVTEAQVRNSSSGDARKYKPAHGWMVGITTYIDTHGNFRVKK